MKKYKLSSFLVISPTFYDERDRYLKNILMSTRSMEMVSLHSDYIKILQHNNWEILPADTIKMLTNAQILVEKNENELLSIVKSNKERIQNDTTLSFVVQPTSQCQLRCDYCGQKHSNNKLTASLKLKIIERYENLIRKHKFSSVYVSWFGGEPLIAMPQIEELSLQFIDIAKQLNCKYGARVVTNGLNLTNDKFYKLINNLKVNFIEVTLDGTKEFHDKRRWTKKKQPTFEKIFSNIIEIVNSPFYKENKIILRLRCNVDKRNYEGVIPLIELLKQNNLQDKIYFYVAPIHSWGNDAHQLSLEKKEFANKEIEWIIRLKEYGFKTSYIPNHKPLVCMAVKENSELIDNFGNLYNCTEISYVPAYENTDFVLGNLLEKNNSYKKRKFSNFNDLVLEGRIPCFNCSMFPVCGGGCPKSWDEGNNACPSSKYNIEEKLLLYYAEERGVFDKTITPPASCRGAHD